jgi:hypothetical protein
MLVFHSTGAMIRTNRLCKLANHEDYEIVSFTHWLIYSQSQDAGW